MAGIYVHIPFCKQACHYCDFHFSTSLKYKADLVTALCEEIKQRKSYLGTSVIETLYLGGGTPSLLSAKEMDQLLNTLQQHFSLTPSAEITIECNPDDLTPEKLKHWQQQGFNRLSIGLQSFNDTELKWMNRAHTAHESLTCVKRSQDAGFNNISIDLIYGSKFQNEKEWEQTLAQVVELNIQHISAYNLTIEPKTALGVQHAKGKEPSVNETLSRQQFLHLIQFLNAHGFEHYEISNFAKPNCMAQHNSRYWLGYSYLGIGPSAHSYNGAERQWNVSNNARYIKQVQAQHSFFETEILSTDNRYNEYILTRLRTKWGCNLQEIEAQFGNNYRIYFLERINTMSQYLLKIENTYCLNEAGKLMADKLAVELFI